MSTVIDISAKLNEQLIGPIAPVVGIHQGLPADEYHRINAASNSRLTKLERSAAHLRAAIDEPREPTDAMEFGTAAHFAVLQPDFFSAFYLRGPDGPWNKNPWKAQVEAMRAENPDLTVLHADAYDGILRIVDSVYAHPAAAKALTGSAAMTELSCVWLNDDAAIDCKARIDLLNEGLAATVEFKTALDASDSVFEKQIYNLRYYRQGAFYLDGMEILRPDVKWQHHIIIATEKTPPFATNVFRVREDAIQIGRDELRPLLARYAKCIATNEWPAYGTEFKEISLPPWAWDQVDERIKKGTE
jgi:hypothetical protein